MRTPLTTPMHIKLQQHIPHKHTPPDKAANKVQPTNRQNITDATLARTAIGNIGDGQMQNS
jgi:hypothetical protein